MIERRDYDGLVRLLPMLRHLPDSAGVTLLDPQEAHEIRNLGFDAQTGAWCVPQLPSHLVRGNPILEALGDDADVFWRPRQSTPEPGYQGTGIVERPGEPASQVDDARVQNRPPEFSLPEASETDCAAILGAVERAGRTIERRKLQKKLWRIKAVKFNHALDSLRRRGLIQVDGNLVVALRADQGDSALFHGVPQTNGDVPQGESAVGPPGAAGGVSAFRGYPTDTAARKVIENAH